MTSRKPCTNVSTATYTGKEFSPLKSGLSAEGYDINTVMEGGDKLLWVVQIKNNRKVWVRKQTTIDRLVHEDPIILNTTDIVELPKQEEEEVILKPKVEEKKLTDYNLYLTYKLFKLKEEYKEIKTENKELLNKAIAEWKIIKKNPNELTKILEEAKKYNQTKKR